MGLSFCHLPHTWVVISECQMKKWPKFNHEETLKTLKRLLRRNFYELGNYKLKFCLILLPIGTRECVHFPRDKIMSVMRRGRGQTWTIEECQKLLQIHREKEGRWDDVAPYFPNRSVSALKNQLPKARDSLLLVFYHYKLLTEKRNNCTKSKCDVGQFFSEGTKSIVCFVWYTTKKFWRIRVVSKSFTACWTLCSICTNQGGRCNINTFFFWDHWRACVCSI